MAVKKTIKMNNNKLELVIKMILITALSVTVHLSIPLLNVSLIFVGILTFVNGLIYAFVAYTILH